MLETKDTWRVAYIHKIFIMKITFLGNHENYFSKILGYMVSTLQGKGQNGCYPLSTKDNFPSKYGRTYTVLLKDKIALACFLSSVQHLSRSSKTFGNLCKLGQFHTLCLMVIIFKHRVWKYLILSKLSAVVQVTEMLHA